MNRQELQVFAEAKLQDAVLLQANGRSSNAFYLAGYAVEFALKACIARQFRQNEIPDKRFVNDIYSHDLQSLVRLAGLVQELHERERADDVFAGNWLIVNEWTPESRYTSIDPWNAEAMLQAVGGVLAWIRQHW